jgi:hypothetical protein
MTFLGVFLPISQLLENLALDCLVSRPSQQGTRQRRHAPYTLVERIITPTKSFQRGPVKLFTNFN